MRLAQVGQPRAIGRRDRNGTPHGSVHINVHEEAGRGGYFQSANEQAHLIARAFLAKMSKPDASIHRLRKLDRRVERAAAFDAKTDSGAFRAETLLTWP